METLLGGKLLEVSIARDFGALQLSPPPKKKQYKNMKMPRDEHSHDAFHTIPYHTIACTRYTTMHAIAYSLTFP